MSTARPKPTANASGLPGIIAAEAACVGDFVALLEKEQQSLSAGRVDELPELTEQKSALAGKLTELAQQRNAKLAGAGHRGDRRGIEAWVARHPSEKSLVDSWDQVSALAARARELNRVNGELIAMRMQYNARALEALRGGSSALDLYGPDGQATGAAGRRINDAV